MVSADHSHTMLLENQLSYLTPQYPAYLFTSVIPAAVMQLCMNIIHD